MGEGSGTVSAFISYPLPMCSVCEDTVVDVCVS